MTDPTAPRGIPESVEQMHANFLREAFQRRAAELGRLADAFDRLGSEVGESSTYSQLAERAVHELMWGLANLKVDRLVNEAAGADIARAKGE